MEIDPESLRMYRDAQANIERYGTLMTLHRGGTRIMAKETPTERSLRLRAAEPIPKRRHDGISELRLMAEAEGYVMIRRSGATPFVKTRKWWIALPEKPE